MNNLDIFNRNTFVTRSGLRFQTRQHLYDPNMLKGIVFTIICHFSFVSSFSQTISSRRRENLKIDDFYKLVIPIKQPEDFISISGNGISVIDARSDSSGIGLIQLAKLQPRLITTRQNFRPESERFVNEYVHCTKTDSFSIVAVMRRFWITTDVFKYDEQKIWDFDADTSKQVTVNLFEKIEFYICQDSGYYVLNRYDSMFSVDVEKLWNSYGSINESNLGYMVQYALETAVEGLGNIGSKWRTVVSSKKRFTWSEIQAHNEKYFDIPILTDSLPVPGGYLTFDEFRANKPSMKQFEVTKDKLNDVITVTAPDGRQVTLRDAWGYCDSNRNIYVRLNHNYFGLQRRQNAFYVYGSKQTIHKIDKHPTMVPAGYTGTGKESPEGSLFPHKFKLLLKPFQLDWDSGKFE